MTYADSLVHNVTVDPATKTPDPRSIARQLAVQFLFQLEVQKGTNLTLLETFLNEYTDDPNARQLAQKFTLEAWKHSTEIDQLIKSASQNWDLNRINLVDRSNLRLAVHQLLHCPEVPYKVVINEAVEIAKTFSTAQAPAFTNGILDVILKKLQQKSKK